METKTTKYPRTYHFPWSPGTTSDDRKLSDGWFDANGWAGKEIVITEKLDGENTMFSNTDVYSRSHAAPTRSAWSRNLWDTNGLLWSVKDKIGDDEYFYGENLYGEHSIHYDKLTSYFYLFAGRHGDEWYGWDDVTLSAEILGVPTVPVLWRGVIETEEQLKALVDKFMSEPSTFGVEKEGLVIRWASGFKNDDFSKCVCKWVRPHHVQTGVHWTRSWKKAELITYKKCKDETVGD